MDFAPGQRWISDAEPELGLGTVLRVEGRSVQVLFARAGVLRSYAQGSAPLSRAAIRVGQRVAGKGVSFVVERIDLRDGLFVYTGEKRELAEGQLDDEQTLPQADDRLISARLDKPGDYELRKQALHVRAQARRSPAWGLASARIDLLPHQLGVVAACADRRAPRVLLADEVGLGKTIEAGMILARLLASGRATRVLVLLPEALLVQWFVELQRRFNLAFAILNEERCEAIETAGDGRNPFEDEQLVLAALPWLLAHPQRAQQALDAGWDVVVVDEAHHLEWTPQSASQGYALVERFATISLGLILLTATPEQLGRSGHFARLRLLDPARYTELDAYLDEADGYVALSQIADRIANAEPIGDADRAALIARFPRDDALHALLAAYPLSASALLDALIDRHGTGRVMFRNRRAVVGGFPRRTPVLEVRDGTQLDDSQRQQLLAEFIADTHPACADFAPDYSGDARVDWLLRLLDAHPQDRFLLICRSRVKVQALEAALRIRSGTGVAHFHEDMSLLQRDRAAAWFAQPDGARLLLCSEIGSEGRNFQFAHRLVLWDLPLDPDLLEQRIGRLDRIGQRSEIALHALVFTGTAQHALLRWHDEGNGVFRASPVDGRELLRRYGDILLELAVAHARCSDDADQELDALIAETAGAHASLSRSIHDGRDRLLDLAGAHRRGAAELLAALRDEDADMPRADFLLRLFEQFGVHNEELGDGSVLLDPEHLSTDALPGFVDGPRRVTFDRNIALAREELPLLRIDHPLVAAALDLMLAGEHGNTAFLADEALPPRSALLEAVFVLECVAARTLDVERFLPPTPLVVCVDSKLAAREYTPSSRALARAMGRGVDAERYRKFLAQLVPPMLRRCEELAREGAQAVIHAAAAGAQRALGARHERLQALAAVNPGVRAEEVEAAAAERTALTAALAQARPRLDAVRFAVSPDFLNLR